MKKIEIQRVYDSPEDWQGYLILVDRLWPRGLKKEDLKLDDWAKNIAPSTIIRKEFNHKPEAFPAFRSAYRKELDGNAEAQTFVNEIQKILKNQSVTLLYAAKSREYNQAVVLKEWLEEKLNLEK